MERVASQSDMQGRERTTIVGRAPDGSVISEEGLRVAEQMRQNQRQKGVLKMVDIWEDHIRTYQTYDAGPLDAEALADLVQELGLAESDIATAYETAYQNVQATEKPFKITAFEDEFDDELEEEA